MKYAGIAVGRSLYATKLSDPLERRPTPFGRLSLGVLRATAFFEQVDFPVNLDGGFAESGKAAFAIEDASDGHSRITVKAGLILVVGTI